MTVKIISITILGLWIFIAKIFNLILLCFKLVICLVWFYDDVRYILHCFISWNHSSKTWNLLIKHNHISKLFILLLLICILVSEILAFIIYFWLDRWKVWSKFRILVIDIWFTSWLDREVVLIVTLIVALVLATISRHVVLRISFINWLNRRHIWIMMMNDNTIFVIRIVLVLYQNGDILFQLRFGVWRSDRVNIQHEICDIIDFFILKWDWCLY